MKRKHYLRNRFHAEFMGNVVKFFFMTYIFFYAADCTIA